MEKINSNLAFGPMSQEVIEAIFRYSNFYRKELMIIASKNQIDYNGGYVNNWKTSEFMNFIREMKNKYLDAKIKVCRDHCGPGFNEIYDLDDTYKTIRTDIENGFDLIHIDFCHFEGSKYEQFRESKKAIEYCSKLNPNISIEIGTDENFGDNYNLNTLEEIEKEIDFFTGLCKPEFYVVQTGSLIKEINQIGKFNRDFIKRVSEILKPKGVKLKEHNADYLSKDEIKSRQGIVDAMNIAPQLGVIQTMITLTKCLFYGIDFNDFLDYVYERGKWKKWMQKNNPENKFLCSIIAGHYHFASDIYKNLIRELEKREDIKENIINGIMEVIRHYDER